MTDSAKSAAAERLHFLAPGLAHELGNAVFNIRYHTGALGSGDLSRSRAAIQRGCDRAHAAAEVLQWLTSDTSTANDRRQVGVSLRQLVGVLRVPCRAFGVQVEVQHSSIDSPALVDAAALCVAVVDVVRGICGRLPVGFRGHLTADVVREGRQVGAEVTLTLRGDAGALPFPIDLASLCSKSAANRAVAIDIAAPDTVRLLVRALQGTVA